MSYFPNRGSRGSSVALPSRQRAVRSGLGFLAVTRDLPLVQSARPGSETRPVSYSLGTGVLRRGKAAEAKNAWRYTSTSRVSLHVMHTDNLAMFSVTDPQTHLPSTCSSKREFSYTRQFVHTSCVPQRNEPCLIPHVV